MKTPERFESEPEITRESLLEALRTWDDPSSRELLTRWKLREEAQSDAITEGPERGKGRILVVIEQAALLEEAGNEELARAYLADALMAAQQENHTDLITRIEEKITAIESNKT